MKNGKTTAGLIGALKRLFDEDSFDKEGQANHVLPDVQLMNPEHTVLLNSTSLEVCTITALMGAQPMEGDNVTVVKGLCEIAAEKVQLTIFSVSFLKDVIAVFDNLGEDLVKIGYAKKFPLVVMGEKTMLLVAPRVEDEEDDEDIPDFDDDMLDEDTTKEEVPLGARDIPAGSRATTVEGSES